MGALVYFFSLNVSLFTSPSHIPHLKFSTNKQMNKLANVLTSNKEREDGKVDVYNTKVCISESKSVEINQ